MDDQQHRSLPQVVPQRGFAWLPLAEQVVIISLVGLILATLLPTAIDSARATGGRLGPALHIPTSRLQIRQRLARHYDIQVWMREGSPAERRVRLRVFAIMGICVLAGAIAGRFAQQPARAKPRPVHFAPDTQTHVIRAHAVLRCLGRR